LSAFFWLLAIWAYLGSVERKKPPGIWTVVFFLLALMAKPMAITLPFVLLLLDFWPLKRLQGLDESTWGGLVLEKWPLLALAAVWCGVTVWAQGQAVATATELSLSRKLTHTPIAYFDYVRALLFPWHLAAYYPYQREPLIWGIVAGIALLLVTLLLLAGTVRWPWLGVGWLWFLGMLVPVIGLVQVGGQAWADRYVYLPSIGFFIIVAWAGAEWAARFPAVKLLVPAIGAALAVATVFQLQYWTNTETLYSRAMEVTSENYVAMTLVGSAEEDKGNLDRAIQLYRQALATKAAYPEAHYFLACALEAKGQKSEAMEEYQAALKLEPEFEPADVNIGLLLAGQKKFDKAEAHYQAALAANPESAAAENDWGVALASQGRWAESIAHYQAAIRLNPALGEAHRALAGAEYQYGLELEKTGRIADALERYLAAVEAEAEFPEALQHAAWIEATDARPELRNGPQAVQMAERANQLTGGKSASILLTLSAAYAEAGRFDDALATAVKAENLAREQGASGLIKEADRFRASYAIKAPIHGH
jgi:tetratricopeptide (TPR) repeat protein